MSANMYSACEFIIIFIMIIIINLHHHHYNHVHWPSENEQRITGKILNCTCKTDLLCWTSNANCCIGLTAAIAVESLLYGLTQFKVNVHKLLCPFSGGVSTSKSHDAVHPLLFSSS